MTTCSPASVAELSECLRRAHRDRLTLRVLGRDDSSPSGLAGVDIAISLAALQAPVEHAAGDLIATLPAGLTLGAANAHLQREGQWLPLDPPDASHLTIGALVATNASGPRRHRHGSPRDLIIGVELALSDGRLVKAGGRVVKNVAGYDLARMMCGSLGSLAIVISATFKLSPLPAASRTVLTDVKDTRSLQEVLQRIATAPCTPAAVEIASPPHRILVRFETTAAAADEQARSVVALSEACSILTGAEERALWDDYEDGIWHSSTSLLRISVLPSRVATSVERVFEMAAAESVDCRIGGRGALGVLHVRLTGRDDALPPAVDRIRQFVAGEGGSTVVIRGPAGTSNRDEIGDSRALMQSVKARFDPHHLLNPGSGPGGL